MKIKNYLLVGLLCIGARTIHAQCRVDAGEDQTIVCGDSVQLYGEPNWSYTLDPGTERLHGVFFINSNKGFTVGESGAIRKTIDGGVTWTGQNIAGNPALNSVSFANDNIGYVAGAGIYKTIDGGATWTQQTLSSTDKLNTIYFLDANTGFAVGDNGKLFKTINGGVDWIQKTTNTTDALRNISFPSASTGYVCAGTFVLKTIDGGETWTKIATGTNQYYALFFTSANTGYVTGADAATTKFVFKTLDGGGTWNAYKIDWYYGLNCIFFTDANTGYMGSVSRLFKTTDGGKNWRAELGPMVTESIYFPNPNVGYATAFNGGGMSSKQTIKYVVPDVISWTPSAGLSSTSSYKPIARPTITTTYKFTSTTGSCVVTDSIKITVNPLIVDAGANVGLTCGGSAQLNTVTSNLNGNVPVTYSWLPATGLNAYNIPNPIATLTKQTTYTVTVTTPNGCTAIDSVTVSVDPFTAEAWYNRRLTCGDTAQLSSVTTNYTGNGALTYSWLPTQGLNNPAIPNPIANSNKETVYHVTVTTPNGCTSTDSITVFVDPFTAEAGNNVELICGGSVQFNGIWSNYKDHSQLLYSWNPAQGIDATSVERPKATVTSNKKYYVTVMTPNGCSAKDSIEVIVNPLTANAGSDKLHVCGEGVQLDAVTSNYTGTAPLIYSWLPVEGLNDAAISNPTSTESGITYTATLTTANGCHAADQVQVDIAKMNAIQICIVGVDSTGKNSIQWNKPASGAIDSVLIYRETTVSGNYVKIGSTAGTKSSFRDNSSQPDVKSNKYKITVLDSCGLETEKSAYHKTMHLAIAKGVGTSWNLIWESYEGFSVPTYNIYRGTNKNDLQFLDATSGGSNQYTNYNPPPGDLYYQVEVVNPSPCTDANLIGPLRSNVARNTTVGIKEQENNLFSFSVYPNPANEVITVQIENTNAKNAVISIYNTVGELVKFVEMERSSQQINVSDLTNGFYMIELKQGDQLSKQKLILQR